MALLSAALLSPALRLYPKLSVKNAGAASWLSPFFALPVLLLYALLLCRLLEARGDGEGLAELILHRLGRLPLCLTALWLTFYAAFVLRSGADRFITTVYPNSRPAVFCVTMALLALAASLKPPATLMRTAKLVLPLVFGVLLFALLFSLRSVERENLAFELSAARGAVPALDVLSAVLVYPAFLMSDMKKSPHAFRSLALWLTAMCAVLSLLSVTTVGSFGAELCARLEHPFFSMVRNFVLFKSVERIEALVVGLWVFPDFLLSSLLVTAAAHCLRCVLRGRGGRAWTVGLCLAAGALSLVLAPDAQTLRFLSEKLIPAVNMSYAFGFVPAVCLAGKKE